MHSWFCFLILNIKCNAKFTFQAKTSINYHLTRNILGWSNYVIDHIPDKHCLRKYANVHFFSFLPGMWNYFILGVWANSKFRELNLGCLKPLRFRICLSVNIKSLQVVNPLWDTWEDQYLLGNWTNSCINMVRINRDWFDYWKLKSIYVACFKSTLI